MVAPPVAVGGVGGSGTRVGAALLRILGYSIGCDLNESLDNLWFTFLFKRRSVLLESDANFEELASLFFANLAGTCRISEPQLARLRRLADDARMAHSREWLVGRLDSFVRSASRGAVATPWAWKEPNTHVVIDRLFEVDERLRYLHFVRHPLDMVMSDNQNQLQTWGPIFLNRDVVIDRRTSLTFWCEVQRRAATLVSQRPDRAMLVDFDALCDAPDRFCRELAAFLGVAPNDDMIAEARALVQRPRSTGRHKRLDLHHFNEADLRYIVELGYDIRS